LKLLQRAAFIAPAWVLAVGTVVVISQDSRTSAPAARQGVGSLAEKGVIHLFTGKAEELSTYWTKGDGKTAPDWIVNPDGSMRVRGGDIMTRMKFENYQLHVEFKVPLMINQRGQARGNSGVFMQGRYEVQVLDSYGLGEKLGKGDCGSIYNTAAPLMNACKAPEEWQAYDLTFRAPRFDKDGKQTEKARVTVILNGIVTQDNTEIPGPTWGNTFGKLSDPGPIVLQDHNNPVEYRNVWIRPLPAKGSDSYDPEK
jgi:hypothetical protein